MSTDSRRRKCPNFGDSKDDAANKTTILDSGHYQPLVNTLFELIHDLFLTIQMGQKRPYWTQEEL